MSDKTLKPCPFCGGEAKIMKHLFNDQSTSYGAKCKRCLAETFQFFKSREKAIDAWNRRAGEEGKHE